MRYHRFMSDQAQFNPYSEYIDIADKTDRAADYLSQGKLRIDQTPIEAVLSLYEKLSVEGLVPSQEFEYLLSLFKIHLTTGDSSGTVFLLHIAASGIRNAIDRYNSISDKRCLMSEIGYLRNNERISDHGRRILPNGQKPFSGKGVVYTCVTGKYDEINDPEYITPGLDYILFTDDSGVTSGSWTVRIPDNPDKLAPRSLARRIKMLPWEYLPEYDYSVWIDGKIQPVADITEYIGTYGVSESMLCFNHYECRSLSDEARLIIDFGKESSDIVNAQINEYFGTGYPDRSGAVDTCVLAREHHDPVLRQTMNDWWREVNKWSMRDQLSFGYVCWKNDLIYDTSPLYVYGNQFFKAHPHK